MNTPPRHVSGPRPASRIQLVLVLALSLFLVLVLGLPLLGLVAYANYTHVGQEARSLLRIAQQHSSNTWQKKVEISVGSPTFFLVRRILPFCKVPWELRSGLDGLRSVDVGVYNGTRRVSSSDRAHFLGVADRAMEARGWERLLVVHNSAELVAVYAPGEFNSSDELRACLVIMKPKELVVVSARGNTEPILAGLQRACDEARGHWPARSLHLASR